MELIDLGYDRFLKRNPDQTDSTKGAVYTATNPRPKLGDTSNSKQGQPNHSTEDGGAPNILTGTVIISCIIQTSALPSRAELSGNDLTFFDDTSSKNGQITGDTSRIVFTHGSAKQGSTITSGFILQKRASTDNTYDNVLELFALDNSPNLNFLFIGRRGLGDEQNINVIEIAPNHLTSVGDSRGYINGIFRVRVSRDNNGLNYRDGVYIMDRGTESSSREGTVNWLVGGGEGGQVRLSYMPKRSDDPLNDAIYDIYVSSTGINFFVGGVIKLTLDMNGLTLPGLATTNPGGSGRVWNDSGTLKIT